MTTRKNNTNVIARLIPLLVMPKIPAVESMLSGQV
jgi:hypothetical protein